MASLNFRASFGAGTDHGIPPLVFIHGAGGSSLHWPPQLRRLPDLDIYALDLPGHGNSSGVSAANIGEKVVAILEWKSELGLGACVFAGHSMGGAISLTLALEHPAQVAGLILVGSGGRLRVHPEILELTSSDERYPQAVELIMNWSFSGAADEGMVALAGRQMLRVPPEVIHADFLACDQFDVLSRVGEVACPVLILCGSEDRLTPPKYSEYLADHIADATLAIIEGAGHMVMLEQPEPVARQITAFFRAFEPREN